MHEMTEHYLECALWASTDDKGRALDGLFSIADLPPETVQSAEKDCQRFLAHYGELIGARYQQAGHDFWLTRNHHGSGFWDGEWPKEIGERLTKAAHEFGECDLYVGDDGKVYCT